MRIIFFNHFHRGDLFTHKEFIRHLKALLPDGNMEYWHFNHPKVNLDLKVPLTNTPHQLDRNVKFYDQGEVIAINTWIGVWGDIFARYGGVNIDSLYDSWGEIYKKLKVEIHRDRELYLPTVDYSFFNVKKVDSFIQSRNRKRILICNGKPMSNQSFESDLSEQVNRFALKYNDVDFICTKKIATNLSNIYFTDDIIGDNDVFIGPNPYWNDRSSNTCDLNEISYLSTHCDGIIGKNSGPFVFCETAQNLKDASKVIVSFCKGPNESMANNVAVHCKYKHVSDHSEQNINNIFEWVMGEI